MTNSGIIGSGNIGGAPTRLFTDAGHKVTLANSRGPASLADLAQETDALPTRVAEVAQDREIVVVAVPMQVVSSLPSGLFDNAPKYLIVIDTSNYYPRQRDGRTIIAENLLNKGKPSGDVGQIALAVAGDDPQAKATVMRLVGEIGFDAVDAGTIEQSWRQQPGSPGHLKDCDVAGVRQALVEATQQRTPEWRATPNDPGTYASPA